MALVGVSVGVTLHLGSPTANEYFRCEMRIDQIDTSLPIQPQLEASVDALRDVFALAKNKLDDAIEDALRQ